MSEFPELDKLTREIQGGRPSSTVNSALILLAIGIMIIVFTLLCIYAFFKALGSI
jgi:hypothetical protein